MYRTDFADFRALLDRLADVFGKPKPDDVTVQAYWNALRDLALPELQRAADRHTRYGKFFPKPVELRPKDDKPPPETTSAHDAVFRSAVLATERTWNDLRASDAARHEYEHGFAAACRIMAATDESSPAYAEAKRQMLHFADKRRAAWGWT